MVRTPYCKKAEQPFDEDSMQAFENPRIRSFDPRSDAGSNDYYYCLLITILVSIIAVISIIIAVVILIVIAIVIVIVIC